MKKHRILAAIIMTLPALSHAYEINTKLCTGIEHIYDESGELVPYDPTTHIFVTEETPISYIGHQKIPFIESDGQRHTTIYVTNTAPDTVNFHYSPTFYDRTTGLEISISTIEYWGVFNASNTPLASSGAILRPNSTGTIYHPRGTNLFNGIADIYWNSSTCLNEAPLITSVRYEWHNSNIGTSTSYYMVNNGANW